MIETQRMVASKLETVESRAANAQQKLEATQVRLPKLICWLPLLIGNHILKKTPIFRMNLWKHELNLKKIELQKMRKWNWL